MRIGITGYPTYGGSGVVATELGQELAARGHDVHFITYAPPIRMNPNDPRVHFHQAAVVSYPLFDHSPYTLSLAVKMLEVFEAESLDILHVHYAIPHSVSALLARQMAAPRRLPFITTLHGTDITLVGNNPSFLPITLIPSTNSASSAPSRSSPISSIATCTAASPIPNYAPHGPPMANPSSCTSPTSAP
jgi:N-acetyl-alpha-D-glucosaminyl L-malate synthase BshA